MTRFSDSPLEVRDDGTFEPQTRRFVENIEREHSSRVWIEKKLSTIP
jgi:hypothetical protein